MAQCFAWDSGFTTISLTTISFATIFGRKVPQDR